MITVDGGKTQKEGGYDTTLENDASSIRQYSGSNPACSSNFMAPFAPGDRSDARAVQSSCEEQRTGGHNAGKQPRNKRHIFEIT